MLSKVYHGHSFYHACRYIVTKQGAQVLNCEGVRSHDFKLMAEDFIMQQALRPGKEKACFHASLSFYPGEQISDDLMIKLAKEYLERLGITNTQYAITKHTDRRHPHLHIVANLVSNEGKAISDSYLGLRGKKTAQQITEIYNLVPAVKKNLHLQNRAALRKSEANRLFIYRVIKAALSHCRTMEELEAMLKQKGITTIYKCKGGTTEKQGISFRLGSDIFKGSKVDRQFSFGNLQKQLLLSPAQKSELHKHQEGEDKLLRSQVEKKTAGRSLGKQEDRIPHAERNKGEEKLLHMLLKPEESTGQTPQELLPKKRKKKKKGQNRNL